MGARIGCSDSRSRSSRAGRFSSLASSSIFTASKLMAPSRFAASLRLSP